MQEGVFGPAYFSVLPSVGMRYTTQYRETHAYTGWQPLGSATALALSHHALVPHCYSPQRNVRRQKDGPFRTQHRESHILGHLESACFS